MKKEEKHALLNEKGHIIKRVAWENIDEEIKKLNAKKNPYYHVASVVQLEAIHIPANRITDDYFMGSNAWALEVQKGLYLDDFYEGGKYDPLIIHEMAGVDAKTIAKMVVDRLVIECDEKLGEGFIFLEDYNCIVRVGDTYQERVVKEYYDRLMSAKDDKEKKYAFDEFSIMGGGGRYLSDKRKSADHKIEDLFRDGYLDMGNISYDERIMTRLDREHPDLKYEVVKEKGNYKIKIIK